MTDEELGRHILTLPAFRPMRGMLGAWEDSQGNTHKPRIDGPYLGPWAKRHSARIVLADPATFGCVVELVRGAWGDPLICTAVDNTGAGWWVEGWADKRPDSNLHDTEAAALVAALEAAPVGGAS